MRHILIGTLFLLGLIGGASTATAFPHFQFSSDTETCSMCHAAPAGGGILTGWGRDEAADTLSRGGDGEALHGVVDLPEWLTLGGDFRAAGLAKQTGESAGPSLLFFPMQADLATRVTLGKWAAVSSVGLRGQARRATLADNSTRNQGGIASRIVSREHYLSWQATKDTVVRAGRYYAPYGLRLADHTSYIRRYLGFNILEETYGLGTSHLKTDSEYHATLHVSDVFRGADEPVFGATTMGEWRTDTSVKGASLRLTHGNGSSRGMASAHYKRWFEGAKLLLMAEVDGGYQRFDGGSSRMQMAAYAGPVWFPTDGVSVSLGYELFDEDIRARHVERHALTYWLSFLPRAHYEILYLARAERIGTRDAVYTGLLQLHYYL